MEKIVKFALAPPFEPLLEVVGYLVLKLHFPYSDRTVTIQVNPFVTDYVKNADGPNVQVRELMVTKPTDETKVLAFDLLRTRKHTVVVENASYEIELLDIGKQTTEGQDFPWFEFKVRKG